MHKKIGSFQGLRSYLFFLAFMILITPTSWAATTQFLVIAPGQSYSGTGTAPDQGSPSTQVAGEAFGINIFCYNDGDNLPRSAGSNQTSLSSVAAPSSVFSPSSNFNLPETYQTVSNSRRGGTSVVTADLRPAATGSVDIAVAGAGGITGGTTSLTVQRITQFTVTKPGTITAGTPFAVTIEARDASALCDAFNGSAVITAINGGENGTDITTSSQGLGSINFVSGKYMGYITLYHATGSADLRVNKSNAPAVNMLTGVFTIDPASFTKILVLAPGETHYPGTNGGDGQQSSPSTQTAGSSFAMTAYGCDDYWNINTSASGTVTLTSEDTSITGGGATSFSSGVASFAAVTLYVVGDGNLDVTGTHSGAAALDTTIVPLNPDSLDSFGFTNSFSATYTAGSGQSADSIALTIIGVDAYGNSVSTITGTTTMAVKYGPTTLSSANESWNISPTFNSAAFTNGVYSGTLQIKRANNNYTITISNTTGGVSDEVSSAFDVNAGPDFWHIVVMPGQTHTPGERHNGIWGRNNSPSNVTAGIAVTVNVYATDSYGNQTNRSDSLDWDAASHLSVTDALASASPDPIIITNGTGSSNITLTVATTTQDLSVPFSGGLVPQSSGTFTVAHTTLDHFSASAGAVQTAGDQFTLTIRAQDQYDNDVQNFSGDVYVTCPPLDYFSPTESVLQIDGSTKSYNSTSITAAIMVSGSDFSAGVANRPTRIYRAAEVADNAYIFVSDVGTDTPSSNTGNIGQSATITVNPNTYRTVFAIVPGLVHRPGADASGNTYFAGVGYFGSPLSQEQGIALSVTIYATDLFWNVRVDANDDFTTTTSPDTSDIHNVTNSLFNGFHQLNTTFNANTDYSITITSPSPGVDAYTTPYTITSFSVDHFDIELVSGGAWPLDWVAGVPVNLSITAWEDGSTIATTFNGTADLSCTIDHSPTLKVIRPTSINFENGVWNGNVTLFRANRTPSENNNITVAIGSTKNNSPTVRIGHNDPAKMLVVEEGGMELYNGLNPDVDPTGELSIQGQPSIQTAGSALTKIDFYLCDAYWNRVTGHADSNGSIQLTCTDPFPAQIIGEGNFSGGTLNVNLVQGIYEADNTFVLYKVNGTTGQEIGVNFGGYTGFNLGSGGYNAVPVRHADPLVDISSPYNSTNLRFTFDINTSQAAFSGGEAVAGVPFAVTIAVVDAYGNTLDSLNGAAAFGSFTSVNLGANTDIANKSIWPTKLGTLSATQWTQGVSYPWIYLYKKVTGGGQFLTASYDFGAGGRTGVSQNFNVKNNVFQRLVAYTDGMTIPDLPGAGGTYVDPTGSLYPATPPPAAVDVFNNFGSPSAQTAGIHAAALRAYTCDVYGNIVKQPEVPNFDISLTTSDIYSPPPLDIAVDTINGYANFTNTFRFHTRGSSSVTFSPTTITALAGTTPAVSVNPGAYYGLQILVPGLTAIEGSGNSNLANGAVPGIPATGWYSGVSTATDTTYEGAIQVEGVYFAVTVQAVDIFGNFVGGSAPVNAIQLQSDDPNSGAEPNTGSFLNSSLSAGQAWFQAQLRSNGLRTLRPYDTTNSAIIDGADSLTAAYIEISQTGQFHYELVVNDIRVEDNQTVQVSAAPNTINVRVEIVHDTLDQIVALSKQFLLEVFTDLTGPTPATGTLSINNNRTNVDGTYTITNETYNQAEIIYIRARDLNATDPNPVKAGFSPRINVSASAATEIVMTSNAVSYQQGNQTRYQTEANDSKFIYATARDANGNNVSGTTVTFDLSTTGFTSSYLSVTQAVTDASGVATTTFNAGAQNLEHTITGSTASVSGQLLMFVTVTADGGVYPNPYNPLLGQPVHIDYPLDDDAPVKIEIYTLLGDLVWTKSFAEGDPEGGHAGVNSVSWFGKNANGITIANGGYICVIKANDNEKYRFKLGVFKDQ